MGDWNAKIGKGEQGIIEKYGLGSRNERGERLVSSAINPPSGYFPYHLVHPQ